MPAESGKLHAHIEPGDGDATDLLVVAIGHAEDGLS